VLSRHSNLAQQSPGRVKKTRSSTTSDSQVVCRPFAGKRLTRWTPLLSLTPQAYRAVLKPLPVLKSCKAYLQLDHTSEGSSIFPSTLRTGLLPVSTDVCRYQILPTFQMRRRRVGRCWSKLVTFDWSQGLPRIRDVRVGRIQRCCMVLERDIGKG
jgi:hypothetical protein